MPYVAKMSNAGGTKSLTRYIDFLAGNTAALVYSAYVLGGSSSTQGSRIPWDTGTRTTLSIGVAFGGSTSSGTYVGVRGQTIAGVASGLKWAFATETQSSYATTNSFTYVGGTYYDSTNYMWSNGGGGYPGFTNRSKLSFANDTVTNGLATLAVQRYGGAGYANSGGSGYAVGGYNSLTSLVSAWQKFSLSTDTSQNTGNNAEGRYDPMGTFNTGVRGYLVGGQNGGSVSIQSVEYQSFATDSTTLQSNILSNGAAGCGVPQQNGNGFYICGGYWYDGTTRYESRCDFYTFATSTNSSTSTTLPSAVSSPAYFSSQAAY